MERLIAGYRKFREEVYPERAEQFAKLERGQAPRVLFITCADSRITPELLFQAEPGELFICRNAGDIVPAHGDHTGGVSATVEYAVRALKVTDIVVCGHSDCGDQVLKLFAHILNEQVRPGDVVARWGGDEFFVLFDCELKDALKRAQQIASRLSTRYEFYVDGKSVTLPLRASAGVVEYRTGESAADLFRRADQAMYAAKPKTPRGNSPE